MTFEEFMLALVSGLLGFLLVGVLFALGVNEAVAIGSGAATGVIIYLVARGRRRG